MYNYNHFQLSILKRYGFCHFIPAFRAGEVPRAECFVKLYITIIAPIMAKEFLNERKDFLFLNLLLMVEKNLSFQKGSAKLKKYLQKGLFEQRSCIVFLLFFLCSRRAPHFGQSPYLHLYFCSPVLGYFPNLTIFSCPHLGHVILVWVG